MTCSAGGCFLKSKSQSMKDAIDGWRSNALDCGGKLGRSSRIAAVRQDA